MRLVRRAARGFAFALILVSTTEPGRADVAPRPEAPIAEKPVPPPQEQPVCLSTERFPLDHEEPGLFQHRLLRELGRQAVLLAIREELKRPTRDETLGEPFPQDLPAPLRLRLETRVYLDGRFALRLFQDEKEQPLWETAGKYDYNVVTIYPQLAAKFAELARTEIAPALREAGIDDHELEPAAAQPDSPPDQDVRILLGEMNFVSQFGAVRAAHAALRRNPDDAAWQEIFARGYAHLALLTGHLWTSQPEAFAARALLYAERFAQADGDSPRCRWLRAYALAVIGAHHAALDALPDEDEAPDAATSWRLLVEPYCLFERDELPAASMGRPELAELVALLRWELSRAYHFDPWIYHHGLEAMQTCPEAYGIYAEMSHCSPLVISRTGAWTAPSVLASRVAYRTLNLAGVPQAVVEAAEVKPSGWARLWRAMGGGEEGDAGASATQPAHIAKALLKSTADTPETNEPSWAVLGSLISEELFCEAAAAIVVSQNATEHSSDELIAHLQTLAGDHVYWPFIASYKYNRSREPDKVAEMLRDLPVVDPRGNMLWLFYRIWSIRGPNDEYRGWDYTQRAVWSRSFTQAGLHEPIFTAAPACKDRLSDENWRALANEMAAVSPHAPVALRIEINYDPQVTAEKLTQWREQAGEDPVLWTILGNQAYELKDLPLAIECYRKSLDVSPSYDAVYKLAACYLEQKEDAKWQDALETFLNEEDLGLTHSQIHMQIAHKFMAEKKWEQAEEHAVAAAETSWSAGGLETAAHCLEGLKKLDESERWVAEACRNYPSYMGHEWYFWCRRTGQGDLDAAKELASKYFDAPNLRRTLLGATRMAIYRTLVDPPEEALGEWQAFADTCGETEGAWDKVWRFAHMAVIADRLGDTAAKDRSLGLIRAAAKTNRWEEKEPDAFRVAIRVCDVMAGEPMGEEFLKEFDEALSKLDGFKPCNYCYFMGAALESRGLHEQARAYYRRAAFDGPFDCYNATLAGSRLVELKDPERLADPVQTGDDSPATNAEPEPEKSLD